MIYDSNDGNHKFTIFVDEKKKIISNLLSTESIRSSIKIIMDDVKMLRTIYSVPAKSISDSQSDEQTNRWLRVRTGDIDCDMNPRVTITYKQKGVSTQESNSTTLQVEDYYEATHMFDLLGFIKSSTQETKRTKISCVYEGVKYVVCFDTWPWIEDYVFVTVSASTSAEKDDILGFIDLLGLSSKDNIRNFDIDQQYFKKYGKTASEMKNVRFDLPIDFQ